MNRVMVVLMVSYYYNRDFDEIKVLLLVYWVSSVNSYSSSYRIANSYFPFHFSLSPLIGDSPITRCLIADEALIMAIINISVGLNCFWLQLLRSIFN